jgi:hypothetical protein
VATGDWLVFMDADSQPGTGLFADMAKEIQSANCIAGGATLRWDQETLFFTQIPLWLPTCGLSLGLRGAWGWLLAGLGEAGKTIGKEAAGDRLKQ